MSGAAADVAVRLSALRLVSFIPAARDAVRVGLLTLDATQVVDLTPLGITDACDALAQLDLLRRTAGAIVHGGARVAFDVREVHLVAPIPMARSVVHDVSGTGVAFADPTTLHGPGSAMTRNEATGARGGLAAVVGATLEARSDPGEAELDDALVGTLLVLGWERPGPTGAPIVLPGAVGPFFAVPARAPERVIVTRMSPLASVPAPDQKQPLPAPDQAAFRALARMALRTHTLRPGDLLTIFPAVAETAMTSPMTAGSWIRVSAPGLGTLSLAVQ